MNKRVKQRKQERDKDAQKLREASAEILKFAFHLINGGVTDRDDAKLAIRQKWLAVEADYGAIIPRITILADSYDSVMRWGGAGMVMERKTFFEGLE